MPGHSDGGSDPLPWNNAPAETSQSTQYAVVWMVNRPLFSQPHVSLAGISLHTDCLLGHRHVIAFLEKTVSDLPPQFPEEQEIFFTTGANHCADLYEIEVNRLLSETLKDYATTDPHTNKPMIYVPNTAPEGVLRALYASCKQGKPWPHRTTKMPEKPFTHLPDFSELRLPAPPFSEPVTIAPEAGLMASINSLKRGPR